ncbi:hypothetical protein [Streptomyces spectabilis]|uniref:Secreted protein n=1 Tax=Streptomyces spectabilis TaxID=68270 RepID=A0A7W8B388_STRST|nr:hypothetical protein [Streptomyces spectabilis]MBB5109157.1 hypothetical protein [Streptomyces spectabilis]MCI3907718.1 hypothetical protein [Streptomyces spectabilis]GGV51138.1 hypothetical protein GCM10010245_80480 [Streptomyces spectabilis]
MIKKAMVIAAGVLVAGVLPSGVANASAPSASANCFANWSDRNQFGSAAGRWCGDATLRIKTIMDGTVKDEAADGRCPYVRAYTSTGAYYDSDWAGPKGDTSPVALRTYVSDPFVSFELRAIAC